MMSRPAGQLFRLRDGHAVFNPGAERALGAAAGVDVVAANDVRYHTPARRRLATALTAVSDRASLDMVDVRLPAAATAHLRSGAEQAQWFRRYPGVVERAVDTSGRRFAVVLHLMSYTHNRRMRVHHSIFAQDDYRLASSEVNLHRWSSQRPQNQNV